VGAVKSVLNSFGPIDVFTGLCWVTSHDEEPEIYVERFMIYMGQSVNSSNRFSIVASESKLDPRARDCASSLRRRYFKNIEDL